MSAIPVLEAPLLSAAGGVRHAFFTRVGGVSGGLYASLNLGRGSGDEPAAVEANRARAAGVFGVAAERLLTAYQVHSAVAHTVDRPWPAAPEGDAIVTAAPGLVCGALSADCAPILMADPQARVVASAHAGWKGALGGVIATAVGAMVRLGAEPGRITAAVGPCIGPASYEVGLEFLDRFMREEAGAAVFFRAGRSAEKRLFDLPGFVLRRLAEAGVTRAEWIARDTLAEPERFFSNRRAVLSGEGDYGRLLSAIMLEPA